MTMDEIKDAADMAEKWPGATVLNWGEMSTQAFCDWVAQVKQADIGAIAPIGTFDLESAKGFFEDWWRTKLKIVVASASGLCNDVLNQAGKTRRKAEQHEARNDEQEGV
jgi:hypothetical protein